MKKILSVLSLALALCLLLSACTLPDLPAPLLRLLGRGEDTSGSEVLTIYRLNNTELHPEDDLLQTELCPLPEGSSADVDTALDLFFSAPADDTLLCAVPDGVTLVSHTMDGGVVTVEFSDSFADCSAARQTLTACAVMLTLCSFETVKAVTVVCGGETLFSELVPEDVVLSGAETDPYVRQLRLFFTDSSGTRLVSEYHSLTLSEETSPERYVVEELLRGPNSDDLRSAIPAGTELLSCSTEDHLCTVNLSSEFYSGRPDTALGERLAIYSLVDSLTALSDVDSVQILVEGESIDTYSFRSLSSPLEWYGEAIDTGSTAADTEDVTLYLPTPALDGLAAFPYRLAAVDGQTRAYTLLNVLLTFEEPGYPVLFSGTDPVNSVSVQNGRCTIDLSEGFFNALPEQARELAVQSIAETICSLVEVNTVNFTIAGQAAVFDGTDWSGPWSNFSETEVY